MEYKWAEIDNCDGLELFEDVVIINCYTKKYSIGTYHKSQIMRLDEETDTEFPASDQFTHYIRLPKLSVFYDQQR